MKSKEAHSPEPPDVIAATKEIAIGKADVCAFVSTVCAVLGVVFLVSGFFTSSSQPIRLAFIFMTLAFLAKNGESMYLRRSLKR